MRAPLAKGLSLAAATTIAAHVVSCRLGRTWGATFAEAEQPLPGDDLVPNPQGQATMAVTIDAPPKAVWPWLVQMGVDRAGLYTHTWVENGLLRLGVRNADAIRPGWQDLAVGDHIWFVPEGYPAPRFGPRVVALDPPHHLVCMLGDDPDHLVGSWQFVLRSSGDSTRLLFRSRSSASRPAGQKVADVVLEPGYLYMNAGMLRGISDRATVDAHALSPVAQPPMVRPDGTPRTALVAVASPQGATLRIARAIADELRLAGIAAELRDVRDVAFVDGYDSVVIGSAIHSHHWMPSATAFVDRHRDALRARPVWLFSSGMLTIDSNAPWPDPYPRDIEPLLEATGGRGHRIFTGRRDLPEPKPVWALVGRMAVWAATRKTPVPEGYTLSPGDFRDWPAIRAWAREIATAMQDTADHAAA